MSPVNKHARKPRPKEVKRAATKLWKTIVPLDSISLAHEKQNPGGTFLDRKKSPRQRLLQEAGGKHTQKAAGAT
jgi:hypothetical protein